MTAKQVKLILAEFEKLPCDRVDRLPANAVYFMSPFTTEPTVHLLRLPPEDDRYTTYELREGMLVVHEPNRGTTQYIPLNKIVRAKILKFEEA